MTRLENNSFPFKMVPFQGTNSFIFGGHVVFTKQLFDRQLFFSSWQPSNHMEKINPSR